MNAPLIHGRRRTISASKILEAIAMDLAQIRDDDGLTWADLGRVMGKSEDQAAKYADATAEMPVTAFKFAEAEWGTRLTGRVDALIGSRRPRIDDHSVLPELLGCATGLATALKDGRICSRDVHVNRKEIEEAMAALGGLLEGLEA